MKMGWVTALLFWSSFVIADDCRESRINADLAVHFGQKVSFNQPGAVNKKEYSCDSNQIIGGNPRPAGCPMIGNADMPGTDYFSHKGQFDRIVAFDDGQAKRPQIVVFYFKGKILGYNVLTQSKPPSAISYSYRFEESGCSVERFRKEHYTIDGSSFGLGSWYEYFTEKGCRLLPTMASVVDKISDAEVNKDPIGYYDECKQQGGTIKEGGSCVCKDGSAMEPFSTDKKHTCFKRVKSHPLRPHLIFNQFMASNESSIMSPTRAGYQHALDECAQVFRAGRGSVHVAPASDPTGGEASSAAAAETLPKE